ncbi:MAG TPA: mannose-1-phosphate guanylyltransferase/mannose-6-phosphate isomerase [Xanthomonadaceae bacterium]|nr:mannose-1-phosphate guanylyltransferase/mannose-6-phosphate isomerase [Xanthomonadaceae bacterium]
MKLFPVILSGGSGTRLWPLSRQNLPKQFLPLLGEGSLFMQTVQRAAGLPGVEPPMVVCSDDHRFLVAEQLLELGSAHSGIVLEPVARNTAPAIALAALHALAQDGEDAQLLVLPADHRVDDVAAFGRAVASARALAEDGWLVTFGICPAQAETGYGYIRQGQEIGRGAYRVAQFVEKPDRDTAQGYVDSGQYLWNSGMFCFRAQRYLQDLERHAPAMVSAARAALQAARSDLDFVRVDHDAFAAAPGDSIDYAVMEKTDRAAVLPVDCGWSDIGSWSALWAASERDDAGNRHEGDVIVHGARNCYVRASERRMVALLGVDDLVVVDTPDATLVAHRDRVQEVKALVDTLQATGRSEHVFHRRVYRPWGDYDSIDMGERFQVKRITVKPGAALSLQKHHHRAEHWVVVSGTAEVTCDDRVFTVSENESTYIPLGSVHRLRNRGTTPVELIEVQTGNYLGEDDIVRLEDVYGRS